MPNPAARQRRFMRGVSGGATPQGHPLLKSTQRDATRVSKSKKISRKRITREADQEISRRIKDTKSPAMREGSRMYQDDRRKKRRIQEKYVKDNFLPNTVKSAKRRLEKMNREDEKIFSSAPQKLPGLKRAKKAKRKKKKK